MGIWRSKDSKYSLSIEAGEGNDYSIKLSIPIAKEEISGVLKNGQLANLNYEVNEKAVFVYLFVEQANPSEILIKGTGRSTGRYKGDIPETSLFKV